MAYKTSLKYNRKKSYKSRFNKRLKKLKAKRGKKRWSRAALKKDSLKGKMKKVVGIAAGVVFVGIFIGTVFTLAVVAKYSSELPDPDKPFEQSQEMTSYVYDRNGNELYKIHGDENRDIAQIEDIPLEVQWAFIAAEDLDFYEHKGVDLGGIIKSGLYEVFKIGTPRGGSTITQQMIKNTVLTNERSYERKIKEIILSLRIEQKYEKEQVLQLYLNEIGFGGNTYGVRTAARIYFGKEIQELTLGEAALLAGLPQAPGLYSPLFASDLDKARELSKVRQGYVLDQMLTNMQKINDNARKYNDWGGDEALLSEEEIQAAREQNLVYKTSHVNIEAPHFVFFVEDELQKGNYNNGKPFTLSEVERGGLKITTSLDLDMQHMAEDTISEQMEKTVRPMGGQNASLVAIDPKTGQVLAMVGSADYFGEPFPEGCTLGLDCKFEPNVNTAVSLRQPGSSLKPMVYYTGFESGQLYPAAQVPDVEITFSGGYTPKNYESAFMGPMPVRQALFLSRNIPAVEAIEIVGVTSFLNTLEKFGYTTFTTPENYGAALALGAGDVKLVEHTNAYSVFANQGTLPQISPILKIEDMEGNVIYDFDQDESKELVKVADERACYLINDILRNYRITPPAGYEYAGKTGTSDENKNALYMGYSPEIVVGIWAGNNDNSRMTEHANGWSTARPVWVDYIYKIAGRFPNTHFARPGGIVSGTVCSDSGLVADGSSCETISDLFIQDKMPSKDEYHQTYRVCDDQTDHLARQIDEQTGHATDVTVAYVKAPKAEWQDVWDRIFNNGTVPTEYCTVNRNPSGSDNPWVSISKPANNTVVSAGGTVDVEVTAYSSSTDITRIEVSLDSTYITQATNNPYAATITIPGGTSNGYHSLVFTAFDEAGRSGSNSVQIVVGDVVVLTSPANGSSATTGNPISVNAQHYGGATIASGRVYINGSPDEVMSSAGGGLWTASWTPTSAGTYTIRVVLTLGGGGTITTDTVTVNASDP